MHWSTGKRISNQSNYSVTISSDYWNRKTCSCNQIVQITHVKNRIICRVTVCIAASARTSSGCESAWAPPVAGFKQGVSCKRALLYIKRDWLTFQKLSLARCSKAGRTKGRESGFCVNKSRRCAAEVGIDRHMAHHSLMRGSYMQTS